MLNSFNLNNLNQHTLQAVGAMLQKRCANLNCARVVWFLPRGLLSALLTSLLFASHAAYANFADCPQHFYRAPATIKTQGIDTSELCFGGFATLYANASNGVPTKIALYSAHHLTKNAVKAAKKMQRVDSFREEERLRPQFAAHLSDYKKSGFDRGHLVPNADMGNTSDQYDSFSLANIVPQNRKHNQTLWAKLESDTRRLVERYGDAYVVTGTAFLGSTADRVNSLPDAPIIPSHLFKAIYIPSENAAAVYFSPNDDSERFDVISVDELQNRTGIMPFVGVTARFAPDLLRLDSMPDDVQVDGSSAFDGVEGANNPIDSTQSATGGRWFALIREILATIARKFFG